MNNLKKLILISTKNKEILLSGTTSMLSLGALSSIHQNVNILSDYTLLLGSFGATSVLVFGFPKAPFSQPKNVMGGNLISSVIGVTSFKMAQLGLYDLHYAIPISVSLATMAMLKTDTVHPPAGGTAMIAALGAEPVASLGYQLIIPTIFGSSFLMSSSLIFNKILKKI
tara:strand:+ start:2314 stop:2820 length:507 start_codon:yes stop_codon:yes gene_type:complete